MRKKEEALFVHREGGWQIVRVNTIDLFQRPEFRRNAWVQALCARVPWLYVLEASGGGPVLDAPPGHFTSYFRCTFRRPYANPFIEDLYWIHEISHRDTWRVGGSHESPARRQKHETWHDWAKRMIGSELVASVSSECLPHFIEGVREGSFKHPIWVDRFIAEPPSELVGDNLAEWSEFMRWYGIEESPRAWRANARKDPEHARRLIAGERQRILEGHASHNDYVVLQVAGYSRMNHDWTVLFAMEDVGYGPYYDRPAFRCIEEHIGKNDPDDPKNVEAHLRWLNDVTPTLRDLERMGFPLTYQLPFACQARSFAKVFTRYTKDYGNAVFFR